jgi:hypothetical protein
MTLLFSDKTSVKLPRKGFLYETMHIPSTRRSAAERTLRVLFSLASSLYDYLTTIQEENQPLSISISIIITSTNPMNLYASRSQRRCNHRFIPTRCALLLAALSVWHAVMMESTVVQAETTALSTSLPLSPNGAATHGNFGVVFFVQAFSRATVTSLTIYSASVATTPVQIYTRSGKYIGNEVAADGWTLAYDNVAVDLLGRTEPTTLLGLNVEVLPNKFQSFLVWSPGNKVIYDPGTMEEAIFSRSEYMEFYEGAGIGNLFSGDTADVTAPRVIQGEIG